MQWHERLMEYSLCLTVFKVIDVRIWYFGQRLGPAGSSLRGEPCGDRITPPAEEATPPASSQ